MQSVAGIREVLGHFPEQQGEVKVIGNLPYYVAVPILVRLEEVRDRISLIIATLQKELADRIRAHPAEKAYGELSVRMQYFYEVRKVAFLPADAFYPQPQSDLGDHFPSAPQKSTGPGSG